MFLILKSYFNKNMLDNDQEWIEECKCLKLSCIQSLTPGISPCLILAFLTFWCFGFFFLLESLKFLFIKKWHLSSSCASGSGEMVSCVRMVWLCYSPVKPAPTRCSVHMAIKLCFCDFRGGGVKMWDRLCLLMFIPLCSEVFGVCVQGWRGSHCCTETRSWL